MIEVTTIAKNRYAPSGSERISMYDTGTSGMVTLGQLVQAVCIYSASVYEQQSVVKMNKMTAGSQTLKEAAGWLEGIANDTADWPSARSFLIRTLGIPAASLPSAREGITSYDRRIQICAAIQEKMNTLSQNQQEEMIDLQTLVSRRDTAFSTSSGVVRAIGQSMMQDAGNYMM